MKSPILLSALLVVGLAGCASDGNYYSRYDDRGYRDGYSYGERCRNCGTVERIEVARYGDGRTTGAGAVAGAIVGAAVGNQIGSGSGRRAATVAGAVAGGVAGNRLEREHDRDAYAVYVRMDDGRSIVVEQRSLNGVREGMRVEVRNGRAHVM